jgi:hypothetical protein
MGSEQSPHVYQDDNPTDEERFAIEAAWHAGEPLPPGWVMVEIPAGMVTPTGRTIPPRTFVMLRESYVAAVLAGQLGGDS